MDWFKILITVLVFYSLVSSFFVKKTKTIAACILLSCALAVGSIFVFELMQEQRELIESSILNIVAYFHDLYE